MEPTELIWQNGEFVAWEDAKVHVLTHGLHYGTGVFEGIRCYETERGPAIFRHVEHLDRLERSAKLYYMGCPTPPSSCAPRRTSWSRATACAPATSARSPTAATARWGSTRSRRRSTSSIACWPWGAYLGEEGMRDGVRAKVSSWERISPRSLIPHAKASGQYLNSVLAKIESVKAGYDEAILLDEHGHVCEGTGENIYVVRDGVIVTPAQHNSILDGITRRSVIQIARDLGYEVVERDIARAELYLADEVFLTGTAAELVPVREIDDHAIGTGRAGRDHARAAARLPGRPQRAQRALPRVARRRRRGSWRPGRSATAAIRARSAGAAVERAAPQPAPPAASGSKDLP